MAARGKTRGAPAHNRTGHWAGGIALAILVVAAGTLPLVSAPWGVLYNETDGQYAAAARTMVEGGSWWVPQNNASPRLVKPPLLYWMLAGSFRVFGLSEFAARFPNALGVAMWVLATASLGWRIFGSWKPGWMAGAILLSGLGMATLGRIIMPEPWFCAWLTWAILAGWVALDEGRRARWWGVAFWGLAGLATFTKGWHGLLLPVAIVGLGGLLAGHTRGLRGLFLCWPGWFLAAAINLPWLLSMELQFPGFWHHFFLQEGVGHVVGLETPETHYNNVPRATFFLLHIAWLFPWILLWPLALLYRPYWQRVTTDGWLVLAWGGIGVGILLAMGQRQDYYGMFVWPVFALAVTRVWQAEAGDWVRSWASLALAILGALCLAAAVAFPAWREILPAQTSALAERATAAQTLAAFDAGVWQSLLFTMAVAGAGLLFGGAASWAFLRRGHTQAAFLSWFAAALVLSLCGSAGMGRVAPYFSHAELARWLQRNDPQATCVAFDGGLDTGSSLLFYWGKPIYLVQSHPEPGFAARKFGLGQEYFWSPDDLAAAWNGPQRVYLITEESLLPQWEILLPGARPFARSGTQVLIGR